MCKCSKIFKFILNSNLSITYNLDYGRITNTTNAHDDAVSCLASIPSLGILISGSWDCSVKYVVHIMISFSNFIYLSFFSEEFGTDLIQNVV